MEMDCGPLKHMEMDCGPPNLRPLPLFPGSVFRSGQVDFSSWEAARCPRTVLNLRFEPDAERWKVHGCRYIHCPKANDTEMYDTSSPETRAWLQAVFSALASLDSGTKCYSVMRWFETDALLVAKSGSAFPLLIHCFSGRDRTGIVCAMLQIILGATEQVVVTSFDMEPEAKEDDKRRINFGKALDGLRPTKADQKKMDCDLEMCPFGQPPLQHYLRKAVDVRKLQTAFAREHPRA
eukprot:844162-Rhodomonas_salina.1